jgi:hypothetical protein
MVWRAESRLSIRPPAFAIRTGPFAKMRCGPMTVESALRMTEKKIASRVSRALRGSRSGTRCGLPHGRFAGPFSLSRRDPVSRSWRYCCARAASCQEVCAHGQQTHICRLDDEAILRLIALSLALGQSQGPSAALRSARGDNRGAKKIAPRLCHRFSDLLVFRSPEGSRESDRTLRRSGSFEKLRALWPTRGKVPIPFSTRSTNPRERAEGHGSRGRSASQGEGRRASRAGGLAIRVARGWGLREAVTVTDPFAKMSRCPMRSWSLLRMTTASGGSHRPAAVNCPLSTVH